MACKCLSHTSAPVHGGAGTAEDGDTVNAADGTDDDSEEEGEEDDEADGTAVDAALQVGLLISAVYAFPSTIQFSAASTAADVWLIANRQFSDQDFFLPLCAAWLDCPNQLWHKILSSLTWLGVE